MFKDSFKPRNPKMIHSCIRDLYELIFSNGKGNDYYSPKLAEYLLFTNEESKELIANPEYKEIFGKYEKNINNGLPKNEEEYLKNSNEMKSSFGGSDSGRVLLRPAGETQQQFSFFQDLEDGEEKINSENAEEEANRLSPIGIH